jgi:hypothetical protein
MSILLTKVASNPTPTIGSSITFTITAQFNGSTGQQLTNLVITDEFAIELVPTSVVSFGGTAIITDQIVNFNASGPITPNGIAGFTVTATVQGLGVIFNSVNASGSIDTEIIEADTTISIVAQDVPVPCLHPRTMVQCGKKSEQSKPISEIRANDIIINHKGKQVKVEYNMQFSKSADFLCVPQGCLAYNMPARDLIIRRGHPILVDGKIRYPGRMARKMPEIKAIKLDEPVSVWSICTQKKEFVMMEGVPVATWSLIEGVDKLYKGTKY